MNRHSPLTTHRVALIGCGTIGSHLAKFLVQSGGGHEGGTITLIDDQGLAAGNIGRHYLGTTSIGEPKASGLKATLLREFPETNIVSLDSEAVRLLENLDNYDLVIDATGEEALSMSINQHFVERRQTTERSPDVIHVRLFGNGGAAQALLVDRSGHACFKCLKPEHSQGWRFDPIKPGAEAVQVPAACGEAQYIAYGVAAPAMAAALGLQMALDWNSGTPTPRLRTLTIEKEGTKTVPDKNVERSPRCPACSASSP